MDSVTVTHYTDEQKRNCVSIPLTNVRKDVHLFRDDFNKLMARGINARWRLSNGQVLERGTRVPIARQVADAGKGQKVQFRDKDCCNLKRDNLVISKGGGRIDAKDMLSDIQKRITVLRNRPQLEHKTNEPEWMKHI